MQAQVPDAEIVPSMEPAAVQKVSGDTGVEEEFDLDGEARAVYKMEFILSMESVAVKAVALADGEAEFDIDNEAEAVCKMESVPCMEPAAV